MLRAKDSVAIEMDDLAHTTNSMDNIVTVENRLKQWIKDFYEKGASLRKNFLVLATIALIAIVGGGCLLYAGELFREKHLSTGITIKPQDNLERFLAVTGGGVAGDNLLCAEIGKEILEIFGGNAVDAAIATTICVGIAQPFSSGIGGGCVMNIFMKDEGKSLILDSREVAAALATETMFVGQEINSTHGALAVAVPGEIKGLYTAWKRFGSLDWKILVEPSIAVAEETLVTELDLVALDAIGYETIDQWDGLKEIYIRNGEFVKLGDSIRRPKLAGTLRKIADGGQEIFYNGELGELIAQEIEGNGGIVSLADLQNYTSLWRDPLVIPYHYKTLHLAPPPFSGAVIGMAMNVIEHDELFLADVETEHLLIESWKWAFGDRLDLGDPNYIDNVDDMIKTMISKDHAGEIRKKIQRRKTFKASYYSDLVNITDSSKQVEDHGTMHLNVIDTYGNMVALTSTINLGWGSKFVGPVTGIVYNNQMDDFSTPELTNFFGVPPSKNNYIAPWTRPMSSMNPTIVSNQLGDPEIAVGASGGTKIITATMQTLLNLLSLNMSAGDSVSVPRLHDQLIPETTFAEENFDSKLLAELREIGHTTTEKKSLACTSMIYNSEGIYHLASDWRKFGFPAGY